MAVTAHSRVMFAIAELIPPRRMLNSSLFPRLCAHRNPQAGGIPGKVGSRIPQAMGTRNGRLPRPLQPAGLITALLALLAAQPAPVAAGSNLVINGNFDDATGTAPYGITPNPGGTAGLGQIANGVSGFVTIGGWTVTCLKDCYAPVSEKGYLFTMNQFADTVGANTPSGARTVTLFRPAGVSTLGSPSGGLFISIDGDYGRSKISQSITGMDTTKSYTLSFEHAGAQQQGYSGATDQTWIVSSGNNGFSDFSLGSTPCANSTLTCWVNPSQGFTAWQAYTKTFTPTSSTINLSFEAWGAFAGNNTPSGDNPPFLLLDNVQLFEGASPSPATTAPGPLPVLGGVAAFGFTRRLRRRLEAQKR